MRIFTIISKNLFTLHCTIKNSTQNQMTIDISYNMMMIYHTKNYIPLRKTAIIISYESFEM